MALEAEHGIKVSTLGVFNGPTPAREAEVLMLLQLVAKLAGKSWAIGIDIQPEQNHSPTGRDDCRFHGVRSKSALGEYGIKPTNHLTCFGSVEFRIISGQ